MARIVRALVKYVSPNNSKVWVEVDCGEVFGEKFSFRHIVFSGPGSAAVEVARELRNYWDRQEVEDGGSHTDHDGR